MSHTWAGWEDDVLRAGGFPTTSCNRTFLTAWGGYEGGAAENNPLNTARNCCGGTPLAGNPDGVKNYPTPKDGANANAGALNNGLYPTIAGLLRAGNACDVFGIPAKADDATVAKVKSELTTWGSSDFASALHGKGDEKGGPIIGVGPGGGVLGIGGTLIEGILGGIAGAGDTLTALKNLFTFIVWLLQPKHWLQMLEVVAGSILIILGLWTLVKVFQGGGSAPSPARAVRNVTKVVR